MNLSEAKELFGAIDENRDFYFAQVPRCVILDKSIKPGAFRLYCYLTSRCSGGEAITWVSQETMANDLELTTRQIRSNIQALKNRGLIELRKSPKGNNVCLIKDVTKLYGQGAKKKWEKRMDRKFTSAEDRKFTSAEDRKFTSSKVEEGEGSELKHKNRTPPSESTGARGASVHSITKNKAKAPVTSTWEATDPFKPVFEAMVKLPVCRLKFKADHYRDWLMCRMEEHQLGLDDMVNQAEKWQTYHNEATQKPKSPLSSFSTWLGNYVEKRDKGNRGYVTKQRFNPAPSPQAYQTVVNNFTASDEVEIELPRCPF